MYQMNYKHVNDRSRSSKTELNLSFYHKYMVTKWLLVTSLEQLKGIAEGHILVSDMYT